MVDKISLVNTMVSNTRKGTYMYNSIADLLFIGDAIDLRYYDFVVGVEELNPSNGVAYNHGEGADFKARLLSLKRPTILILSHQPPPPKEITSQLLASINVKAIVAQIGVVYLNPGAENEVGFLETPTEMLQDEGVVEACPEQLLKMLDERLSLEESEDN